jgi:prenylcysteine alpha-carboxyl methylesterase
MTERGAVSYDTFSPLALARRLAEPACADACADACGACGAGGGGAGGCCCCAGASANGAPRRRNSDGSGSDGSGGSGDGSGSGGGSLRSGGSDDGRQPDAAWAGAPGAPTAVARVLPPVLLLHGTADKTVPHAGALLMHEALQALGVPSSCKLLPGKTHTDVLLEDAFRGGRDSLTEAILEVATGRPHAAAYPCTCPEPLVWLAGCVCPF